MSAKLHELLAVESQIKQRFNAGLSETMTTFRKKEGLFRGQRRVYTPVDDGGETFPPEITKLQETVENRLIWNAKFFKEMVNLTIQKEVANSSAKADVVIDGKILMKDVPATALLAMESKLKVLREVYAAIPTLDPAYDWEPDKDQAGAYKTDEILTYKSKKVQKPMVLAEATTHHPAQVQLVSEDVRVGSWETKHFSGNATSRQKAQWLDRIDLLLQNVTKARMRANREEVQGTIKAGDVIVDYIHG